MTHDLWGKGGTEGCDVKLPRFQADFTAVSNLDSKKKKKEKKSSLSLLLTLLLISTDLISVVLLYFLAFQIKNFTFAQQLII